MHFWEHLLIFQTWNPSRNPGIPRIWFGFANFNVKISFPTQCLSLNKIFNVSFQDSRIPWIFQELSGTLDSCGNGIFLPSSTYRVIVPLNFRPWTLLSMWHSKIPLFLKSSKNYLELLNFSRNDLLFTILDTFGIRST